MATALKTYSFVGDYQQVTGCLPVGERSGLEQYFTVNLPGAVNCRARRAASDSGLIDGRLHFPGQMYKVNSGVKSAIHHGGNAEECGLRLSRVASRSWIRGKLTRLGIHWDTCCYVIQDHYFLQQ